MESIKIEVTGNIARIIEKPSKITASTVGLEVEFTFDSDWDQLSKTAVFLAGERRMVVDSVETKAIVPWEILRRPGFHLNVGVYGVNLAGEKAILSNWVNAGVIHASANPNEDPMMRPTLPVWQKLLNMVGKLMDLKTHAKSDLVLAINEVYDKAEANGAGGILISDEKPTAWPILWFNTSGTFGDSGENERYD